MIKINIFILLIVLLLLLFIFVYVNNNYLYISKEIYKKSNLPEELNGFSIVHLSDLHNKEFGKNQRRIINKIKKLNPDLIVFTGDLIHNNKFPIKSCVDLFKELTLICPLCYSFGNHERYLLPFNESELLNKLKDMGIIILDDSSYSLLVSDKKIIINGLTDPCTFRLKYNSKKQPISERLNNILNKNKKGDFNILLSHRPDLIDLYKELKDIDLIFSGHAHGGQWRIPFIKGLYAPNQGLFPKYTSGIHMINKSDIKANNKEIGLCISRGLGNSRCPLRLFNFPEIKLITIIKKEV